jgi:hypothetical protein
MTSSLAPASLFWPSSVLSRPVSCLLNSLDLRLLRRCGFLVLVLLLVLLVPLMVLLLVRLAVLLVSSQHPHSLHLHYLCRQPHCRADYSVVLMLAADMVQELMVVVVDKPPLALP